MAERVVRSYRDEDEPAVVAAWHAAGRAAYDYLPAWREMTPAGALAIFRAEIRPCCDLWVGTQGERVVAYLAMKGPVVDRLYVEPAAWRRGWGSRLVEVAKELQPTGLRLFTHQRNLAARALYEKHGFEPVRFGLSPPPEFAPDVEYEWRPPTHRVST